MPPTIDREQAIRHLTNADHVMGRIIAAVGPFSMREPEGDPFHSLARSIIFQQISGPAGAAIYRRFAAVSGASEPGQFPSPASVLALDDSTLRLAGLSRQKAASIRSLAEHFAAGELNTHQFGEWDDEEIISHLTRVRGIGRWTAEMFLMFHLRRPDVLPVNDVGINRAIQKHYGLADPPKPDEVRRVGQPWRPWATVACWYLWMSEDVIPPAPDAS